MKLETKVGAFFVGTVAITATLILRMEKLELFGRNGNGAQYTASFDQVAGLNPNSAVRIAGVKVGEVRRVDLANGKALVSFVITEKVPLYRNAVASLASIGILGEKYIDLAPGEPGAGELPSGGSMKSVAGANLDTMLKNFERISADVQQVTASLSATLGGEQGRMKLDEILDNVRVLTGEFRAMAQENRGSINHTMANVEQITAELRDRLPRLAMQFEQLGKNLNGMVEENRPALKGITSDVRQLAQSFQGTSDNLKSITSKLDKGEGTLGKLLTDETTIQKINTAVDSVNDMLSGLKGMEMRLDLSAARWTARNDSLTGLGLELAPRKDYWYSLGLFSTPDGKVQDSTRWVTKTGPDGKPVTVEEPFRTVTTDQSFTVNAMFNKRLWDNFVFSAGLLDSKGGVGAEMRFLQDRLRAGVQAYDFTKRPGKENVRLRFTSSYELYRGLYVQAGVQDFGQKDLRTFFFGGGIRWTDNDLKKLVGLAGSAK